MEPVKKTRKFRCLSALDIFQLAASTTDGVQIGA
jgi:hypothetical protein